MRKTCIAALALLLAGCDVFTGSDSSLTGKWLYHGTPAGCDMWLVLKLRQQGSHVTGTALPASATCVTTAGYVSLGPDSAITATGDVDGDHATLKLRLWGNDVEHSMRLMGDSAAGTIPSVKTSWMPWSTSPVAGEFGMRRYTTEVLPGRFLLTVSGAAADTLEGWATADQMSIGLYHDDLTPAVAVWEPRYDLDYPTKPGTYTVRNGAVMPDSLRGQVFVHGIWYRVREGTVEISAFSENSGGEGKLKGTLDLTAYRVGAPDETVRVRGGFAPSFYRSPGR